MPRHFDVIHAIEGPRTPGPFMIGHARMRIIALIHHYTLALYHGQGDRAIIWRISI